MDLPDDLVLRGVLVLQREEILEILGRIEEFGHQEIQEGPQFFQIVLQWGTCQKDAMSCPELPKHLRKYTLVILDSLGLI
jgi:hypothetical protein